MRKLMWMASMVLGAQLGGCGDSGTGTARAAEPAAGAREAALASYEIVTVTRPESVERHIAQDRAQYDLCASAAQQQGLPVQPFPAVPQQYFQERDTWISDGKVFLHRTENYGLDPTSLSPEKGCATRFTIATSTEVRRGRKVTSEQVWFDGQRQAHEEESTAPQMPRLKALERYTVTKTVAGHRVRCLAPGGAALPGRMQERCVADGTVVPAGYDGKPIVVHLRMKNAQATTDLVMEPQTLRIGGRIDQSAFNVGAR
jgi:hypothetical protein